jgi:hypothetical protein
VPDFSVDEYFSEVLDGVFKALEDPSPAVREVAISVLNEMQHKLNPKQAKNVSENAKKQLTTKYAPFRSNLAASSTCWSSRRLPRIRWSAKRPSNG